jgi:microcystin-dependent protein
MLGTLALPPATSVFYGQPAASSEKPFSSQALGSTGGSQPHSNMMPSLSVNYIIAWSGLFPSQ